MFFPGCKISDKMELTSGLAYPPILSLTVAFNFNNENFNFNLKFKFEIKGGLIGGIS